jgi:hypothetical protein
MVWHWVQIFLNRPSPSISSCPREFGTFIAKEKAIAIIAMVKKRGLRMAFNYDATLPCS